MGTKFFLKSVRFAYYIKSRAVLFAKLILSYERFVKGTFELVGIIMQAVSFSIYSSAIGHY